MKRYATPALWVLALFTAIASARYFFVSTALLTPPLTFDSAAGAAGAQIAPHLYRHHPLLFLPHVGSGIAALVLGLFQFIARLRNARPRVHRTMGLAYLAAVFIGSITGLPLSILLLEDVPPIVRPEFFPMAGSFFVLSIVWASISATAFFHARQRRFREHRAWMMRSYSLTFAAATVRLVSGLLMVLTGDIVFAVNSGVLSWPLNLAVAEWLVRRDPEPALAGVVA